MLLRGNMLYLSKKALFLYNRPCFCERDHPRNLPFGSRLSDHPKWCISCLITIDLPRVLPLTSPQPLDFSPMDPTCLHIDSLSILFPPCSKMTVLQDPLGCLPFFHNSCLPCFCYLFKCRNSIWRAFFTINKLRMGREREIPECLTTKEGLVSHKMKCISINIYRTI